MEDNYIPPRIACRKYGNWAKAQTKHNLKQYEQRFQLEALTTTTTTILDALQAGYVSKVVVAHTIALAGHSPPPA